MRQLSRPTVYLAVPAVGLSLALTGCSSSSSSGDATPAPTVTETKTEAPASSAATSSVKAPSAPSGAKELASKSGDGFTYARYSTSETPESVVSHYESALKSEGYSISNSGGSSGGWGKWGGGNAGVTADKSDAWVEVQAGGQKSSTTYFEVCTGASKSAVDNCDQESNNSEDSNSKGS